MMKSGEVTKLQYAQYLASSLAFLGVRQHDSVGLVAFDEDVIEHVPPPHVDQDGPFLMQVSTLAWSDYIGQIGGGRVLRGTLNKGDEFNRFVMRWKDPFNQNAGYDLTGSSKEKGVHLWVTRGLQRVEADKISAGDIVWLAGPEMMIAPTTRSS